MKKLILLLSVILLNVTATFAQDAFKTTWDIASPGDSVTIYTPVVFDPITFSPKEYDFTINWGDGSSAENYTGGSPNPSHVYATSGDYQISITGSFYHMSNDPFETGDDTTTIKQLVSVDQWGDIQWESMAGMFQGASNMTYNATDAPDLTKVIDFFGMFNGATSFNGDIGNWDVSSVGGFVDMFKNASSFNADISGWNMSGANTLDDMFWGASSFDQNLGAWDVSNVVSLNGVGSGDFLNPDVH